METKNVKTICNFDEMKAFLGTYPAGAQRALYLFWLAWRETRSHVAAISPSGVRHGAGPDITLADEKTVKWIQRLCHEANQYLPSNPFTRVLFDPDLLGSGADCESLFMTNGTEVAKINLWYGPELFPALTSDDEEEEELL